VALGRPVRKRTAVRELLVGVVTAVVRAATGVHWYWTTLMGDHDYARYVAHLGRVHPDQEPESVSEYWRSRHDAPVQARCC
jgi:uncharacterized short protein YbdD (DUF466 family)